MTNYIGHKETIVDKVMFGFVIAALVLLGVTLTQPAWRGQDMLKEYRANCDKVGGVMLETKQPVIGGTTYQCSPRLDK